MRSWPSLRSLRVRLLGLTLATLVVALVGAHWWLTGLFRDHVTRQFDAALVQQLDRLTGSLDFDPEGAPRIDAAQLTDPRWSQPYSGLYWQLDRLSPDGTSRRDVLRSRSLWDTQLTLDADPLIDGAVHTHEHLGPQGHSLRLVERSVQVAEQPGARWRLIVAADSREPMAAVATFNDVLAASLAALGLLLTLAALAQVAVGLAPLKGMQHALERVRDGRQERLTGRFPAEVQPLIDDFNGVLDRHAEAMQRARTQAGNLAHALKTPLAVLQNAAQQAPPSDFQALVGEQVQSAQRHVHWHLARARAAASTQLPGQRTPVADLVTGLWRVMSKLHADRRLDLSCTEVPQAWAFAGEAQDLQEMLGNLLDNACRHARTEVRLSVRLDAHRLLMDVADDGPGIALEQRQAVLQRGIRLDERTTGSGLGLSIVVELAELYGGTLTLSTAEAGGLNARLALPAAV